MPSPIVTAHKSRKPKAPLISRTYKDGGIYLFVRDDYKKPTWQCRIKVPGAKGYITRSTQTKNENDAYAFADKLYLKSLGEAANGRDINSKQVARALKDYIEHVEISETHSASRKSKLSYLKRWLGFFGNLRFREVSQATVTNLIDWTRQNSEKGELADATVRRFLVHLKAFWVWCKAKGYVSQIPDMPRTKKAGKARPDFDARDLNRLKKHMDSYADVAHPIIRRDRLMLVNYVHILLNTGIRVGEARNLKWRDIGFFSPNDTTKQHLNLRVTGKTGKRDVVAMPGTHRFFMNIFELRMGELSRKPKPDEFIFCHPDGKPITSFRKSFDNLVNEAGVTTNSHGDKRTIYSLRHTYATTRLMKTVNVYDLAKNMGTSVEMIEKHYGHTTNVSAAAELTKT